MSGVPQDLRGWTRGFSSMRAKPMLFEAATLPLLSVCEHANPVLAMQVPACTRSVLYQNYSTSQTLPTLQKVDKPTGHFVELDFAGNPVP